MTRRQIVVTVAADGTVRAETVGILGEQCLDYVAVLEDLIDGSATQSSYTADWTRQDVAEHEQDHDRDRP